MLLFVCLLFRLFFSIRGRDALHTRLSASILKLAVCTVELVVAPYAR